MTTIKTPFALLLLTSLLGCSQNDTDNSDTSSKPIIHESFEQGGWNAENTTLPISTHQPGLDPSLPMNFLFAQLQGPHSFSIDESKARSGNYSAKLLWKANNPSQWNGDPQKLDNTDRKAMFHGKKAQSNISTVWYGFSAYFPSEHTQFTQNQGALFFQIHGARDGQSEPNRIPPVALNLKKQGFSLGYSWDSKQISTSTQGEGNDTLMIPANLAEYQDRWVDFVLKVNTNPFQEKGGITLWIDGKQAADIQNIQLGYNDKQGVYPSFGWYLWGEYVNRDQDVVMYLDDVRQAEGADITYSNVAP